jgi:hypothetical protein
LIGSGNGIGPLLGYKTNDMRSKLTLRTNYILLIILGIAHITNAQTQKKYSYRVSAGILTGGNGHGVYYNLGFALKDKQNTFEFMPLYQVLSRKVNGLQFNYIKSLTNTKTSENYLNKEKKFAPWWFCSAGYLKRAAFTQAIACREINIDSENNFSQNKINANTLQFGLGLGGTLSLNDALFLKTFISGGAYIHSKFPNLKSHKKYGPSITIGVGIGVTR